MVRDAGIGIFIDTSSVLCALMFSTKHNQGRRPVFYCTSCVCRLHTARRIRFALLCAGSEITLGAGIR
jgi:hypothetical protein